MQTGGAVPVPADRGGTTPALLDQLPGPVGVTGLLVARVPPRLVHVPLVGHPVARQVDRRRRPGGGAAVGRRRSLLLPRTLRVAGGLVAGVPAGAEPLALVDHDVTAVEDPRSGPDGGAVLGHGQFLPRTVRVARLLV